MNRLSEGILYLLLVVLFFVGFGTPNTALTQDLGRHLLLGDMILHSGSVPKTNLFSYTYPDFPLINHHYLSEVIFYLAMQAFGIDSLLFLTIIVMFLACFIVFLKARKHASTISLTLASLLSLRILLERTDVRPEVFSFLLTAIFVTMLYTYHEKPTKWILLLIPLTFLWTQLHIYFFVGIVLLILFLLDGLIVKRNNLYCRYIGILVITLLGSMVVTFINPNGSEGALYPLRIFDNYGYTIEENQSVFLLQSLGFQKPSLPYFQLSVLLLFISLGLTFKKTRPIDWFLAGTFSIAGFLAVRNLPLFALVCFIPFVRSFSIIEAHIKQHLVKEYPRQRILLLKYLTFFLLSLLLIWQIIDVSKIKTFGLEVKDPYKNAVAFFKDKNLHGPIFNNFDIGSYLIYSLYPNEKVFVDGRPEAYPKDFLQNIYIPMQENQEMFNVVSKEYDFNTIVINHTDQTPWAESFLMSILHHADWVPVYLDSSVLILFKDTPENQQLIDTFGMNYDTLIFSDNALDFQSHLQRARFANLIQHTHLEKQMYREILSVDPTFCPALQNLAIILSNENDPTAQLFITRYQTTCL